MINSLLLESELGVLSDKEKNDEYYKSSIPTTMNDTLKAEYKKKNERE
jgi:hypothetical protein